MWHASEGPQLGAFLLLLQPFLDRLVPESRQYELGYTHSTPATDTYSNMLVFTVASGFSAVRVYAGKKFGSWAVQDYEGVLDMMYKGDVC